VLISGSVAAAEFYRRNGKLVECSAAAKTLVFVAQETRRCSDALQCANVDIAGLPKAAVVQWYVPDASRSDGTILFRRAKWLDDSLKTP
jgi:hypothetical protein